LYTLKNLEFLKVEQRQRQLELVLPRDTRDRIKLTDRELKLALSRQAVILPEIIEEGRAASKSPH
jgi:hypothetical protein